MSSSSLWVVDKENNGKEVKEYKNSWLFCPIVWDELMWKYLGNKRTEYDWNNHYISVDKETRDSTNMKLNLSSVLKDRLVWEFSQAQVMFVKDKVKIANAIREFSSYELKTSPENYEEHIIKRFIEIANDIENISDDYLYFIIHGSSCDDNVEFWFHDNETGEPRTLDSVNENVCEFVIIDDDDTISWKQNLDFYDNSN